MKDTDVYVYVGDVHRTGHLEITNAIKNRKKEYGLQKMFFFVWQPMAVTLAQDIESAGPCNTIMNISLFWWLAPVKAQEL